MDGCRQGSNTADAPTTFGTSQCAFLGTHTVLRLPVHAALAEPTQCTAANNSADLMAHFKTICIGACNAPERLVVLSSTTSLHSLHTAESAARCLGVALLHKHSSTPCGSCCCSMCCEAPCRPSAAISNALAAKKAQVD